MGYGGPETPSRYLGAKGGIVTAPKIILQYSYLGLLSWGYRYISLYPTFEIIFLFGWVFIFNNLFKDVIADKVKLDFLSYKFAVEQTMLIKKWLCEGMQQSPEFLLKISLASYRDFEIYHETIMKKKHL